MLTFVQNRNARNKTILSAIIKRKAIDREKVEQYDNQLMKMFPISRIMGSDGMEVQAIRSAGKTSIVICEVFGIAADKLTGYKYYECLSILEQREANAKKNKTR